LGAIHHLRATTHHDAGQRAEHRGLIHAALERLSGRHVLRNLFLDRLREFLEKAFLGGAVDHLLDESAPCGWIHSRTGQHGFDVGDPKALRERGAKHPEATRGRTGRERHGGLSRSQRATAVLADLLGGLPGRHGTLATRSSSPLVQEILQFVPQEHRGTATAVPAGDETNDSLSRTLPRASNVNVDGAKVPRALIGVCPGHVLSSDVMSPCVKCEGNGWVCKAHPRKQFPHVAVTDRGASDCPGPGMPRDCEAAARLVAALDAKYRIA
jgi:hypothetical protein